jgi:hypothetical protein
MVNTGFTDSSIGYELLEKDGNRIVLDINYDTFILNSLTPETCFIGRVYITNSDIARGIINGCLIKDTSTQPLSKANIEWKQGILFDTLGSIKNIDFNSKSDDTKLILKSIINTKGEVESFYTYNNYGIGLSIINLSNNTFQLNECNIDAGVFNNCIISGNDNNITGGEFYDCIIGNTYTVDGGRLINCEFESTNASWKNGSWGNDYSGTTDNPFKPLTWEDGTWEYGIFPVTSTWVNGRFKEGTFKGLSWNNGEFIDGEISGTTWVNGIFNDGIIYNSFWNNGIFNGGVMYDTTWNNGIFNNGTMNNVRAYSIEWYNGIANDSIIGANSVTAVANWYNGSFNSGTFGSIGSTSIWHDGKFYYGTFSGTEWKNGTFYTGDITTYVNPKFRTNKPFKPYREFGAYVKNDKRKRYPRKRRY